MRQALLTHCCHLPLSPCPPPLSPTQAKAFALLSEEGIAKGVRRIVAVTAADASAAISEGEKLAAEVEKAAALPDAELEQVRAVLSRRQPRPLREGRGGDLESWLQV